MTVSAAAFAGMGAFVKAAADVPVVEKVVVRNLISLFIAGVVAWRAGRPLLGRRENQGFLLLRSLLGVAGVVCYFYAIDHLILAAAGTGLCVNLKKGQFLSPQEMQKVLLKARGTGNRNILLTERGTSFGYNNLVVDFRSFVIMRSFKQPVVFDVTHSVQAPGGRGDSSGGDSQYVPYLARAGAAAGVNGFFLEVHDNPAKALSDGPNALELKRFPRLVEDILKIRQALGSKS